MTEVGEKILSGQADLGNVANRKDEKPQLPQVKRGGGFLSRVLGRGTTPQNEASRSEPQEFRIGKNLEGEEIIGGGITTPPEIKKREGVFDMSVFQNANAPAPFKRREIPPIDSVVFEEGESTQSLEVEDPVVEEFKRAFERIRKLPEDKARSAIKGEARSRALRESNENKVASLDSVAQRSQQIETALHLAYQQAKEAGQQFEHAKRVYRGISTPLPEPPSEAK